MKILSAFFLLMLLSLFAKAESLTTEALQGSWKIVAFNGAPYDDQDYWEFEGDKFFQKSSGRRVSPDQFSVVGNAIDLGYAKIRVLEFNGRSMTANMAGFKYKLEKQ